MVAPSVQQPDPWSLSQDSNFLCYKGQLYVPDHQNTQLDVLCSCHDHCLAGHPGITKTIKNICHQFYWPKMVTFIIDHIHSCVVCCCSKSLHHKPFGPHHFLPIGEQPWVSVSMDFIEGLPLSNGHNMLLVVVCHLTKMASLPFVILRLKT